MTGVNSRWFSFGDYLRSGAMASVAPIISEKRFASEGKPVLGVCNGFQILTEIGLLPGAYYIMIHIYLLAEMKN